MAEIKNKHAGKMGNSCMVEGLYKQIELVSYRIQRNARPQSIVKHHVQHVPTRLVHQSLDEQQL